MQILRWVFKIEAPEIVSNSSPITKKEDKNIKPKDILVFSSDGRRHYKRVEKSKLKCEDLSLFCFVQRKDVSRPWFYHTLNLKRVGSFQLQTKKEERESKAHIGNKVLPITDSEKVTKKGDKMKTISRMKELMKWAASAKGRKSGRMVFNFKNKAGDDHESPKISFRWDMETSSAISSSDEAQTANAFNSTTLTNDQCAADGAGNWITTDSEFVVLEL